MSWTSPEAVALANSVTAYARDRLVPHLAEWEEAGQVPREVHAQAAKAGFLGLGFPEEVGGSGGTTIDAAIATDAVITAGGSSGLIAALFTHGIALPHIVSTGNADLIDRYVRPTLAGEMIGSLAVTEPGGGSDVAGLTTRAERDGDHYVVTGSKMFITSGVRADFYTALVRTGGAGYGGLSLLVIDRKTEGVHVSAPLRKMGWLCSDTAEITFEQARVPATNLVGAEGGGFVAVAQQFVNERLSLAAQAVATAQRCLDLSVGYARDRQTFGRPLIDRQLIRHKLVEMYRATDVARIYMHNAYEAAERGDGPILQAALAKNEAVAACDYVVDEAVQIHGGAGYLRESEVERHYRDSRILRIGGGTDEVMADLAAKLLNYHSGGKA